MLTAGSYSIFSGFKKFDSYCEYLTGNSSTYLKLDDWTLNDLSEFEIIFKKTKTDYYTGLSIVGDSNVWSISPPYTMSFTYNDGGYPPGLNYCINSNSRASFIKPGFRSANNVLINIHYINDIGNGTFQLLYNNQIAGTGESFNRGSKKTNSLYLFVVTNDSSVAAGKAGVMRTGNSINVYSAKVYIHNQLMYDLVPVRKKNGGYWLNNVNNRIMENSGTIDSFTPGPDIVS